MFSWSSNAVLDGIARYQHQDGHAHPLFPKQPTNVKAIPPPSFSVIR